MNKTLRILVVDDEAAYCDVLGLILEREGYIVKKCIESSKVMELLKVEEIDLIVSDLIMPNISGMELLKRVKKFKPDMKFIMMTAFGTIDNAVEAMKEGAFTYVIKGSDPNELLKEVDNIKKIKGIPKSYGSIKDINEEKEVVVGTKSLNFKRVLEMAEKAARSDANVLILGESGVGKEVLANYIHENSKRARKTFLATNCHTFSDNLLESELFGHEKGSFTGAIGTRIGRFEASREGTLFLDEIGDVSLVTQAKLLRAIETKNINRIGSNEEINVDFRLISATNKVLEKEIEEGFFREDLFYRLSTIIIQIPPLRKRREDIKPFLTYFFELARISLGFEKITIDQKVEEFLSSYNYPGNVRELKNIVERLVVLSDEGYIDEAAIDSIAIRSEPENLGDILDREYSLKELRKEVESQYIEGLLKKNMNSMSKTAKALDISTRHLFNKINEYDIRANINEEDVSD